MHTTSALHLDESRSTAPAPATAIEAGELVARAAILICAALEQYQAGKSTLATNSQGAELIAKLYTLKQSTPDIDLARAGIRELRRILAHSIGAEAVCRRHDLDHVLGEIVAWPLEVLNQVTADEQARFHGRPPCDAES
jgi:hypothetical protein